MAAICDTSVSDVESIIYFIIGVLLSFITIVLMILWMKRIHCFPIRERSPYMSLLCLVFLWINTIIIPSNLIFYFLKGSSVDPSPLYVKIMTFLSFFSLFGIYANYILRSFRLAYVAATQSSYFCFDFFMKSEHYLIVINLLIGVVYGLLGIIIYDAEGLSYETVICLKDFKNYEKREIVIWELFINITLFINDAILIFLVFSLKRIKSCYNIVKEFVIMVSVMFFSDGLYYLLFHFLLGDNYNSLIFLKLIILLRNFILIYISFVHTLIICHHGRSPTPTYIIFQDLRYFLYDHTCVTVFHQYIKKMHSEDLNCFLFYLDFVSQRISGKELFKEYFLISEKNKVHGVNNNILKRLEEEYEINEEFSFENMTELMDVVYKILEMLFLNYKNTKSCRKLIDKFEYYDMITERLYAYNMESFDQN